MSFTRAALIALLLTGLPDPAQATSTWQSAEPIAEADQPASESATPQQAETDAPNEFGALVTDRPDATESSETIPRGLFQLESGYTFANAEAIRVHSVGELLLRVGVHDAIELRFGFNSYLLVRGSGTNSEGLQNLGFGAKVRVLSGGGVGSAKPTVALLVGTSIPTGSDEIDAPKAHPEARIAAAWDLSERFSVGTNLIWTSVTDDADVRHTAWGMSLALGYGISERWGAYLEYFGAYPTGDRGNEDFVNTGLTYLIHNDLQLDARVGYGLNDRDDEFFFGVGTAVRW